MTQRFIISLSILIGLILQSLTISPEGATHTVTISNFAFSPAEMAINPGDTVQWVNEDAAPHTSTSQQSGWDSGILDQNQSFSFTFSQTGQFAYYCAVHPSMRGTIRVAETTLPNLVPYLVPGWSEPMVVSDNPGRLQDTRPLYANQDLYLHWVVANTGEADVTTEFTTRILLDGQVLTNWLRTSLPAQVWNSWEGYPLGRLVAGTHRFRMEIDATGSLTESGENDNIFEKTITVLPEGGGGNGRRHDVAIRGFAFIPAELTIRPGDMVQWTNEDAAPHTSTADQRQWNSSTLNQSQSYSFTFTTPGNYAYHCEFRPNMRGTIQVASDQTKPNLHPFQVQGWSAPLIVSATTNVLTDANPIFDNQDLFLSWAVANTGGANATNNFVTRILLDGQELTQWPRAELQDDIWNSNENYPLGKLTAGHHTIEMVIDSANSVEESNEADNTYQKMIMVQSAPGSTTNQTHLVAIRNFQFVPSTLTIKPGDTVQWTNQDNAPHTSTAVTGVWNSQGLNQGETFSFTFINAGSNSYFCEYHPEMRGTIVVQSGTIDTSLTLKIHQNANKEFVLEIQGTPGSPVTLQSSSDLRTWNIIQTNSSFNGTWTYPLLDSPTNQHQFFRAYQIK